MEHNTDPLHGKTAAGKPVRQETDENGKQSLALSGYKEKKEAKLPLAKDAAAAKDGKALRMGFTDRGHKVLPPSDECFKTCGEEVTIKMRQAEEHDDFPVSDGMLDKRSNISESLEQDLPSNNPACSSKKSIDQSLASESSMDNSLECQPIPQKHKISRLRSFFRTQKKRRQKTSLKEQRNAVQDMPTQVANIVNLVPGCLIVWKRVHGLYDHYAIYIGHDEIVHFTGGINDWLRCIKGRIKKEKLDREKLELEDYSIENGTWNGKKPLPVNEIIQNAESKVGQKGYHLLFYNCEHLAHLCRYGKSDSKQADNLLFVIRAVPQGLKMWGAQNNFFPVRP